MAGAWGGFDGGRDQAMMDLDVLGYRSHHVHGEQHLIPVSTPLS